MRSMKVVTALMRHAFRSFAFAFITNGLFRGGRRGKSWTACGQKTEPTSKLFGNTQVVAEGNCDFSWEWMSNSTEVSRNDPCFTIGAYLHRTMTTIRYNSASRSASVVVLEHAPESLTAFDPSNDDSSIIDWLDQLIAESLMISF